ncbi:MAG TPA: shikimate kinase [Kofleriaceae bacterium]|nr:shikimate kinase [Kofleriaceae bacterium]
MNDSRGEELLARVGARVRSLRQGQAMTRRELSERSGVSQRFLTQLEAGRGNISLVRFADVAAALATTPAALLTEAAPPPPTTVALLGVRGAGKSSVGAELARRLGVPHVEVDQRIEAAAGLRLSEIFELHGEAYYRRVEREVLDALLTRPAPMVLATGGSIVGDADNFALLRDRCATVWLRARPRDHWNRVIKQGDRRPMARNPHAYAELEARLAARAPLYARAHHVVDTSRRSVAAVVDDIVGRLRPPAARAAG